MIADGAKLVAVPVGDHNYAALRNKNAENAENADSMALIEVGRRIVPV